MKIDPIDLVTTGEAAEILGVTQSSVDGMILRSRLNVVATVSGRGFRLLDRNDVLRLKAEREKKLAEREKKGEHSKGQLKLPDIKPPTMQSRKENY